MCMYAYDALCGALASVNVNIGTDRIEIKSHVGRNGTNQKSFENEIL